MSKMKARICDKKDLRKSIKQVHVLELNRLSVMKCADSRRNFHFECPLARALLYRPYRLDV
jgi:hypothetical protein